MIGARSERLASFIHLAQKDLMANSFEVQGTIHSMGETTEYGSNGFTKREFVIQQTGEGVNPSYPNYLAFELIKDKCALLDQYQLGDELKVSFNLNGRLWQKPGQAERCFTSLQAWRIEKLDSAAPQAFPDAGGFGGQFDDEDVPF